MAKRTVLRVDSLLELSNEELKSIAVMQGVSCDNLVIDRQMPLMHVDNKSLYRQRFGSICKGARFFLEHIPTQYLSITSIQKDSLLKYISQLESGFLSALQKDDGCFSVCQETLHNYSRLLVSAFSNCLDTQITKTVQWLSKAEEYALLIEPRDDLMTLSTVTNSRGTFYLLQKENQLPPLSQNLLNDYLMVAKSEPPFPDWYEKLEPIEQRFLRLVLKGAKTPADIENIVVNFSSRLRTLPGAANFRNHSFVLYDASLTRLTGGERCASSMISSRDIQNQPQAIRDFHASQNLKQIIDQCIEDKIIDELNDSDVQEGDHKVIKVPVLVQTLVSPSLPEFLQPDYKLVKDKSRAINGFAYNKEEQQTVLNQLGQRVSITLKIELEIQSTNHSLNLANRWDFTAPASDSSKTFIEGVNSFIENNPRHESIYDIQLLLAEYSKILGMGSLLHANYYDKNRRELYLSSLEQLIIVRENGIAYGSCVSAKDRKALEFMHTDAMELYHHFYGTWPSYVDVSESERAKFVDIFSHLYLTRHHHRSAALNAPGSEGIKTPSMYLPEDICAAIEGKYLIYQTEAEGNALSLVDDANASINELRSIVIKSASYLDFSWSRFHTIAQDELNLLIRACPIVSTGASSNLLSSECEPIIVENLQLIKSIVCGNTEILNKFWNNNTFYKADPFRLFSALHMSHPDGVKLIRHYLEDKNDLSSRLIPQLFTMIRPRLKNQGARYPLTSEFYSIIESLCFNNDNLDLMQAANIRLKAFFKKATQTSWDNLYLLSEGEDDVSDTCDDTDDVELTASSCSSVMA